MTNNIRWSDLSAAAGRVMAEEHGEWCGIPLPVDGFRLDIESNNPWRERLAGLEGDLFPDKPEEGDTVEVEHINSWYSFSKRARVTIYRIEGKARVLVDRHDSAVRARHVLDPLGIAHVWNLKAEQMAVDRLRDLILPHLWEMYQLTGTFLETSARSGLTYLFRKMRPTLVLTPHKDPTSVAILTALCLHPIGYYRDTFAGSMVPTDEVIAHLMLLRGDEPLYWRRANQHRPFTPESGL